MKSFKILLFAVIVLFIHSLAYSQSIRVISPNGGENWVKGTTHNITWTSSGITTGTFVVWLYDGETSIGKIKLGIPCTDGAHSISWIVGNLVVGGTAYSGSNFKIKVRQTSLAPKDFSDAPFTISEGGGYSGPIIGTERAPVEILDTVSVKAPINAPVRKLETTTKPITPAYKFQIQAIKPILNTPDRVKFQVQYYISPGYPEKCYISASITSPEDNVYMSCSNTGPGGTGGVPKGQNYFSHNILIGFKYMKSTPFTSSQVKIKIYGQSNFKNKTLTVKYINWSHTWIKQ